MVEPGLGVGPPARPPSLRSAPEAGAGGCCFFLKGFISLSA